MSLHPVVGHSGERASLARALSSGRLPAALLLHGPRGVGKQRVALWLAQLVVCARPEGEPCGACPPCRMALSLEHPDVHWYFPLQRPRGVTGDKLVDALEAARLGELAEIRSAPVRAGHSDEVRGLYMGSVKTIRERIHKRPAMGRGPVFVVGDAELLVPQEASQEAANALLKLLEEPPGRARFILTSSEPGRLLPTIRSRTVPYHLTGLPHEEVATFLEERAGVDAETAAWAAGLAQGSIGRALGFIPDGADRGPLESLRRRAYELVAAAVSSDASEAYGVALGFPPAGARGLVDLFAFVEEWLRDLAAVAAGSREAPLNRDAVPALVRLASEATVAPSDIARASAFVERARELALGNVNPQLVVHGLVRDLRGLLVRPADAAVV